MSSYRIWIGISTIGQPLVKNIKLKNNEYHPFRSDKEAEEWVKNVVKSKVDYFRWFKSGKYAILKEDGSYIIGRYVR